MMKKAKNVKDQTEKITTTSKLVGVSFCALLHVCICVSARALVCVFMCAPVCKVRTWPAFFLSSSGPEKPRTGAVVGYDGEADDNAHRHDAVIN